MEITLINWLFAFSPVIVILILMTVFKMGGSKAGIFTVFVTLIVGIAFFGVTGKTVLYAYLKAFILSLDVLLIIWGAMFLYQVTKSAGTIQRIGGFLVGLTDNKAILGIFLGWLFPSFLQGMGGFGVPVAVSAPLLVSAGFSPALAVILTSIGHGWGVSFGSMGSSIRTMQAVSGISAEQFAPMSAVLLGITAVISGFFITYKAGGLKDMGRSIAITLMCGGILAGGQYLLANTDYWIVAVTIPSLVALIAAFFYTISTSQKSRDFISHLDDGARRNLLHAIIPYLVLVVLIFVVNFFTPLRDLFKPLNISFQFPSLSTRFGFTTPAESGKNINPIIHPGMIILYSGLISFLFLQKNGYLRDIRISTVFKDTVKSSKKTTIAIFSLVGSAVLMNHAGMTEILAKGISSWVPHTIYPAISPFIGGLGAFITGSNNNSNVLFASLQMQTAQLIGLPISVILASQTAGGALGSIMAPAKVILGCSTVGLAGKEGTVIGKLLIYGLMLILIIGISTTIILNSGLLV